MYVAVGEDTCHRADDTAEEARTVEIVKHGATGEGGAYVAGVGGGELGGVVVDTVNHLSRGGTCGGVDLLVVVVGMIALCCADILSGRVFACSTAGEKVQPLRSVAWSIRFVIIGELHIVSASVAGAIVFAKGGARSTGCDSLARHHVSELGTTAVFAHDAAIDDHIDITFHNFVGFGHHASAVEFADKCVVYAPNDVALDALLIGGGDGAEAATVDITFCAVVVRVNILAVAAGEVETGEIATKGVDGAVTCLIAGTNMGSWSEGWHNKVTSYNNICDMLVGFFITASGVLVKDTTVENNRTVVTSF